MTATITGECQICGDGPEALRECDECGRATCCGCHDVVTIFTPDDRPDPRGEKLLCRHCLNREE
jgi:hypothetical protein